MRKCLLFILALLAMYGCSNEDVVRNKLVLPEAGASTGFVNLVDDSTRTAGVIKIVADAPEAEVTWITTPLCNLDTTQTTVILKNGMGELPVQWLNEQQDGKFAPKATAFKAWVRIKAGDKLTDIPLILSECVDSVSLTRTVQTRSGMGLPKVISLSFVPTQVNMQTATGGDCQLMIEGPGSVKIDYTNIKDEHRINKVGLPETVTGTTTLNFRWIGGVAPTIGFSTTIRAEDVNDPTLWTACTLKYDPNGDGNVDLEYVSSNMPTTGNLPATSSVYTFTFKGTYTGAVQLRTLSAGKVLNTATAYQYPDNQPKARVPENTGAKRPIQFEYRAGAGMWTPIPQADRIQDGTGVTPPDPGAKPTYGPVSPAGDIPDGGGEYNSVFSNYVGKVYFRAVSGEGRLFDTTSGTMAAGGFAQLFLTIPEAVSMKDNQVLFQCSTDSLTWETMETRKQIVETFGSGSFSDMPDIIPAGGGIYHYASSGTLSAILTIVVQDDKGTLTESRGAVGGIINVTVPANTTGQRRALFFRYKRSDIPNKLYFIQRGDQAGH